MKTLFRGCLTIIALALGLSVLGIVLSQPGSGDARDEQPSQRPFTPEELRQQEERAAQKAKEEAEAKAKREAANRVKDAFYTAKEFVKDSLKAPSTASFESWYSDDCGGAEVIPGKFCVWGVVEAKNPFGVPLREKWRAALYLRPDGKYVRLFQRIGDQDIGDPGIFAADGGGPITPAPKR